MANPTTTVRQAPAGIPLDDGFSIKIAFARDPDVSIWEKTVKPSGIDGGDPIDTTTQHNQEWRTMRMRQLKTLTPSSGKAAFDPACKTQLLALINQEGSITERYPDGTTYDYFGALRSVEFDEMSEGTHPELSYVIQPTNWDPVNNVEAGPVLTNVVGT